MKLASFALLVLIPALALLPACAGNDGEETAADGNVTLEEVAETDPALVGETVVIKGEFVEKKSDVLFSIQDESFLAGEAVLILNAADSGFTVPEDEESAIWVTGEVRQFSEAELVDYDIEIDPVLYAENEGRPVVVAKTVVLAPSPEDVADNPDVFYGQPIIVYGEVESVISAGVFTIEAAELFDTSRLLVVGEYPDPVQAGDRIAIRGQLQPFVTATFEQEYDLTFDQAVQAELEAEFTDKPVLLAEDIAEE
ncbi:hypothetical protein [Sphaerothrix gracilis]|uniref:hypothetical protein n=1 Tax=Sphaerothrix gracilis TaxID=3151835 RepID=UPI0031FD6224